MTEPEPPVPTSPRPTAGAAATAEPPGRVDLRPVKRAVEDALLARAGVVGVDIAEKLTDGQPAGVLAIVVHVEVKRGADELDAADRIPQHVQGVPTDVVVHRIGGEVPEKLR